MFYKQIVVNRTRNDSVYGPTNEVHHCWVPEQFAKVGKYLKLLIGETWEDGWRVIDVGTRMTEEYVVEHERDYKTQREASDI